MRARATYFLGRNVIGRSEIETQVDRPHSHAFFCDACGDLWARIVVEGGSWNVELAPCQAHHKRRPGEPGWGRIGGSFLRHVTLHQDYLAEYNAAIALENLPPEVLRREFALSFWAAGLEL